MIPALRNATSAMNLETKITLIVLAGLAALTIGLALRHLIVRRLKNSVLDAWLVHTLGIFAVVIMLLIAAPVSFAIFDVTSLVGLWNQLLAAGHISPADLAARGGTALLSLIVLLLSIGIGRTVRKMTVRNLGDNRIDINTRTLIGRILSFVILGVAIFWILSLWQISITAPVALLGTAAVSFTFAIQDILKDLVAGFYILVERPFHIGDEISIDTFTGRVEDVQLRTTRLRLVSGEEIMIPNARIFSLNVVNNTFYGERRLTLTITLPQEDYDRKATSERLLAILHENEQIMPKPEPDVILSGYTPQKVTLTVRFWIASGQYSVTSDVIYALREAYPQAEVAIKEAAGTV